MSSSFLVESRWNRVGSVPPAALRDARLQLHHATQIAVSAAISYLQALPDDSHTALTWSAADRALASEPITGEASFRIGVRVEDLTLLVVDHAWQPTRTFALAGRTVTDAYAWLLDVAAEAGLDPARLTPRKHYTIPAHPVHDGSAFSAGIARELAELSRYWSNASGLLEEIVRSTAGASSVRTWPHHFDIATLAEIQSPIHPGATIGIGQSPGDDSYEEPYWYVGPRPHPPTANLPALAGGGHWHTRGWVGAALPASAYIASSDQRGQVAAFVESGVAACRKLFAA